MVKDIADKRVYKLIIDSCMISDEAFAKILQGAEK